MFDDMLWGDKLVRGNSADEMDDIVRKLWEIVGCTGGWVGAFGEGDQLDDLEVRIITHQASEAELEAVWTLVKAGTPAKAAWVSVQGPSWRYWTRSRALKMGVGPATPTRSTRDIDTIVAQLRTVDPELRVRYLPESYLEPGEDHLWIIGHPKVLTSGLPGGGTAKVQLTSRDGNCPFVITPSKRDRRPTAMTVPEVIEIVLQMLAQESDEA